jgi:hypothetical protein
MTDELKDKKDEVIVELDAQINPPEGYSQDEWNRLSKEDKEGIVDLLNESKNPDISEDEEALSAIAGDDKTEKKEDEKKDESVADVKSDVKSDDKKPDDVKLDDKVIVVEDVELLTFRPVTSSKDISTWLESQPQEVKDKYVITVPETMVTEYNKKLEELKTKLNDDEITKDDYDTERDKLRDTINDFKASERDRVRDQLRDDVVWDLEQRKFYAARTEYLGEKNDKGGFTKTIKSAILFSALQAAVNHIDDTGLSGMQVLVKADNMVKKELGLNKSKEVNEDKKDVKKDEPKKTQAQIAKEKGSTKLPDENLGDVAEAGANEVGDKWDVIDRMPDKKREEWLKSQPQSVVDAYVRAVDRG